MAARPYRWVGALIAALVAGCAAGGPLEAPTALSNPDAPGLAGGVSLMTARGGPAPVTVWGRKAAPKAVLLALHGYGDHGRSTFDRAATAWATRGIMTIAPDQRGFGRSPSRALWPGADALIADAAGYVAQIRTQYPCAPLMLLGHSMGGGIALAAAPEAPPDGLILATPAIWGGPDLNPFHRATAWLAAITVPDQRFSGRGVVRIQASDNIAALRKLARDPLYLSPPSAREILGLVRITDRAHAAARMTETPALMLLGEKDQIVPNETVRAVFATLSGPTQTIAYADGWHLLFRDLQAERVWADVAHWIVEAVATRPTPKGCP